MIKLVLANEQCIPVGLRPPPSDVDQLKDNLTTLKAEFATLKEEVGARARLCLARARLWCPSQHSPVVACAKRSVT